MEEIILSLSVQPTGLTEPLLMLTHRHTPILSARLYVILSPREPGSQSPGLPNRHFFVHSSLFLYVHLRYTCGSQCVHAWHAYEDHRTPSGTGP